MTKKIIVRPSARQDLIEQFAFIDERSQETADRFLEMFDRTLGELSKMPEMGSPQQFNNPHLKGVRRWRIHDFEKHLIFYRPVDDGIEILRVLYASRDIAAIFEE